MPLSGNGLAWTCCERSQSVFVLILHFPTRLPEFWDWLFYEAKLIGWAGVDLFFVLSGFLIAHLLLQEFSACGKINVVRFWTRRAFKIYPSLYFLIALSVSGAVVLQTNLTVGKTVAELLFVQNYFPHLWLHTWSIAVEEHFYLLIALLFIAPNNRSLVRNWPVVVGTIMGMCLVARISVEGPFTYETHLYPTHLRIDSLFVGTFVAYLFYFHRQRTGEFLLKNRFKFLVIGCALVRFGFWGRLEDSRFVQTIGLTLLSIGCAVFVALTVFDVYSYVPNAAIAKPIILLGRISYGTYLWHMAALTGVEHYFPSLIGTFQGLGFYLAISVALGLGSTRLIEDPLLRFRNRVFPRPQSSVAAVVG